MFRLKSISNLPDFLQCQKNLDTVIIWIFGLYLPHDNISFCSLVKWMLEIKHTWTFVRSSEPFCDRTCKFVDCPMEYQDFRCVSNIDHFRMIWEHSFDNFSYVVPILLLWIDGYQDTQLIPCKVGEESCLSIHKNVPYYFLIWSSIS